MLLSQLILFILQLVALFAGGFFSSLGATNYFVSPSGSDSGAGSESVPFRTIAKGLSVVRAGETLFLRGGTYAEYLINNVPAGSSSARVTIRAYPSETVVIRPGGGQQHVIYLSGGGFQYITFLGLSFDAANVGNNGIKLQGGSHHIRFENCEVKNAVESGFLFTDGSGYNEVVNSDVHHNGRSGYAPPTAAYGLYIATANNRVESCAVHDNVGYGIHIYSASGGADNNTVRNCRIYNNGRNTSNYVFGLLLGPGGMGYNNLIYGNQRGVQVYNSSNCGIYFNTIYNNQHEAIQLSGSNNTYRNNILYLNPEGVYGNGTNSNNLQNDPKFVSSSDFHLQSNSPAIGAGMAVSGITTDFEGKPRPNPPSIGAFEADSGGGIPSPPIQTSQTEPAPAAPQQQQPSYSEPTSQPSGPSTSQIATPFLVAGVVVAALLLSD